MSDNDDTSIRISVDTWKQLKDRKERPNESFDDVIQELIQEATKDEGNVNPATGMAD